jgi:hypothetical protein
MSKEHNMDNTKHQRIHVMTTQRRRRRGKEGNVGKESLAGGERTVQK